MYTYGQDKQESSHADWVGGLWGGRVVVGSGSLGAVQSRIVTPTRSHLVVIPPTMAHEVKPDFIKMSVFLHKVVVSTCGE